jgi:hypothetical protein
MTTKNWTRLRAVREYIGTHPEDWEQQAWRCNTGMCFAGQAVAMDGATWLTLNPGPLDVNDDDLPWNQAELARLSQYVLAREDEEPTATRPYDNELEQYMPIGVVTAEHRAMNLLGLTRYESQQLFDYENKLADIDRILARWAMNEDWSEAYAENAARVRQTAATAA